MFHMWNKKKILVTIDLWYASKLLEKNDFLAKSRILLEMVGLYQLKTCFKQKELQNSFTCMRHPHSIVEECHSQAIVLIVCHIFLSSVHVQHYPWWIWHPFIVYISLIARTWIQTTPIHSLDGLYMDIVSLLLCYQ